MKRADLERFAALTAWLGVWQLVKWLGPWPDYVLPSPLAVLASVRDGILGGTLPRAVLTSLLRLVIGYGLASAAGVLLGIGMGRSALLERSVGTLLTGLQSLPSICWMPLALLWFGLNERAILFVVVIATLGTVALAVRDAVLGVPRLWLRAARSMGERGPRLWWRVILPATLPGTLSALRIGWSFAWRALMAGELLFVAGGLGQVMHVGRELNDMPQVMAGMLVIVVLGLLFDHGLLGVLERRTRRRWGLAE
ncbi:MAG: ABC transporter permease [Polyangiaceae bacterium]